MKSDDFETVLDAIPEPMRHFYKGIYTVICYTGDGKTIEIHEDDLNLTYSPSRSIEHAPSFYAEAPPLPGDATTYVFDPLQFLVLTADLDSEASIIYLNVYRTEGLAGVYWQFVMNCTEGDTPPPDDMCYRNYNDYHNIKEA